MRLRSGALLLTLFTAAAAATPDIASVDTAATAGPTSAQEAVELWKIGGGGAGDAKNVGKSWETMAGLENESKQAAGGALVARTAKAASQVDPKARTTDRRGLNPRPTLKNSLESRWGEHTGKFRSALATKPSRFNCF